MARWQHSVTEFIINRLWRYHCTPLFFIVSRLIGHHDGSRLRSLLLRQHPLGQFAVLAAGGATRRSRRPFAQRFISFLRGGATSHFRTGCRMRQLTLIVSATLSVGLCLWSNDFTEMHAGDAADGADGVLDHGLAINTFTIITSLVIR